MKIKYFGRWSFNTVFAKLYCVTNVGNSRHLERCMGPKGQTQWKHKNFRWGSVSANVISMGRSNTWN